MLLEEQLVSPLHIKYPKTEEEAIDSISSELGGGGENG
jgi:hypothetical protein